MARFAKKDMSESGEWTMCAGGVTAPRGFMASTILAGIKPGRKRHDMALLVSDIPAAAAGVFTANRIKAAPVRLCQQHLAGKQARAIIINAGNANACTGAQGMADAENISLLVAGALGIPKETVLVCSTGTIGIPMPMHPVEAAIPRLVATLDIAGGNAAATAILTTDTVEKQLALRLTIDGATITIGGMCKGSGMISPAMATMLAFITTDAAVSPDALQRALRAATDRSFNCITVDGDMSTNDTVLCLANGMAGNAPLDEQHPAWPLFQRALNALTLSLAQKIVCDGEGATRFVTVHVRGALTSGDAHRATRAIANSPLVKTSWYGGDPNWGRVIAALGYSGAQIQEDQVEIRYNDLVAVQNGRVAAQTSLKDLERVLAGKEFAITIDLHLGSAEHTLYTCDCSEAYVRINAEYMT